MSKCTVESSLMFIYNVHPYPFLLIHKNINCGMCHYYIHVYTYCIGLGLWLYISAIYTIYMVIFAEGKFCDLYSTSNREGIILQKRFHFQLNTYIGKSTLGVIIVGFSEMQIN